jgi:hypothetical protein
MLEPLLFWRLALDYLEFGRDCWVVSVRKVLYTPEGGF